MNACFSKIKSSFSEMKSRNKVKIKRLFGILNLVLLVLFSASCGNHSETKEQKNKTDMETIHLNKANFDKLFDKTESQDGYLTYKGDSPAIIDFYASWCGPCKMLAPVLEELAVEYKGRVRVYKVDIDVERELANSLRIMSIPTLFLVREDGQMKVLQGAVPKTELKKIIDGFLLQ
mgnify:FL=1